MSLPSSSSMAAMRSSGVAGVCIASALVKGV